MYQYTALIFEEIMLYLRVLIFVCIKFFFTEVILYMMTSDSLIF